MLGRKMLTNAASCGHRTELMDDISRQEIYIIIGQGNLNIKFIMENISGEDHT